MADGSKLQIVGLLRTYHVRLVQWCQNGFINSLQFWHFLQQNRRTWPHDLGKNSLKYYILEFWKLNFEAGMMAGIPVKSLFCQSWPQSHLQAASRHGFFNFGTKPSMSMTSVWTVFWQFPDEIGPRKLISYQTSVKTSRPRHLEKLQKTTMAFSKIS
jgi:hypothetical protein